MTSLRIDRIIFFNSFSFFLSLLFFFCVCVCVSSPQLRRDVQRSQINYAAKENGRQRRCEQNLFLLL